MKKFVPKTDSELLKELHSHLVEGQKIVEALQLRESLVAISCEEGKEKRRR